MTNNNNNNNNNNNQTPDLSHYITYLQNQNKAQLTINSYTATISQYYSLYPTLSRSNIQLYKQHLKEQQLSAQSINQKISSLKNYNLYLIETNQETTLHILKSDLQKIQSKGISPTKIDSTDIQKFFTKVESTASKRNIALIYLIISTGIRREESISIKLSDLDLKTGTLIIRNGKGSKQREVYLHQDVINTLKDYIDNERNASKYAQESQYLFVSQRAEHITKETVNAIMKPFGKNKITPHQLRHYFATNNLQNGMTIVEVANLLGHSSISTTQIYTNPTEKEMRKKLEKANVIRRKVV